MTKHPMPFGVKCRLLNEAFVRRVNHHIQHMDLTMQQSHMLKFLSMREDRSCSLKELERFFGMAQSTIAGIAVRLEKKGLIESVSDPGDRRVKRIRLTEAGIRAEEAVHGAIMDTEAETLSVLSREEQQTLNLLMDRVIENLMRSAGMDGIEPPMPCRKEQPNE